MTSNTFKDAGRSPQPRQRRKPLVRMPFLGALNADLLVNNLSFIVFLSLLAFAYIANSHYTVRKIKKIQAAQEQLKELRWEVYTHKAAMMSMTKYTELEKLTARLGLRPSEEKPTVINLK